MGAPKDLTETEWRRIVAVYSKHSGKTGEIMRELGWPKARVNRLWRMGYSSMGYPPIKTLVAMDGLSEDEIRAERLSLEEAQLAAASKPEPVEVISAAESLRLKALVKRDQDRERARADAVKSRAEEATLVSSNRRNAMALNAVTAQLLMGATKLSGSIQRALEKEAAGGTLSLRDQLYLVRSAASVARFNSEATVMAVKAERMVLGQPINADSDSPEEQGTLDEAAAWIERAAKVVARAKARGLVASSALVTHEERE